MYRIRFHGRGGQGIKTASRILGSAFFAEGFEVQDAPRYGAERRGAPMFAYVRAARTRVDERGLISHPDLVVVTDASLLQVPAAGVMNGLGARSVLLIAGVDRPQTWRRRLGLEGAILTLPVGSPSDLGSAALVGTSTVGAAARLIGNISFERLEEAIRDELGSYPGELIERNLVIARQSFDAMAEHEGCVHEGDELSRIGASRPAWVNLESDPVRISAPSIQGGANSDQVQTGLWRTMRPEVDEALCRRCSWICSTLCPDGAIDVGPNREPIIDYDHCKGCLICAAVCPTHAILVEPEDAPVKIDGAAATQERDSEPEDEGVQP